MVIIMYAYHQELMSDEANKDCLRLFTKITIKGCFVGNTISTGRPFKWLMVDKIIHRYTHVYNNIITIKQFDSSGSIEVGHSFVSSALIISRYHSSYCIFEYVLSHRL